MLRFVLACVVATLLVTASSALADSPRQQIYRQCQDNAITGNFTAQQLRDARDHIPSDIDQYSDCRGVLSRAILALAGGSGTSGGAGSGGAGGGTGGAGGVGGTGGTGTGGTGTGGAGTGGTGAPLTPSTPADQQALADAGRSGGGPVTVGGTPVIPGSAGLGAGATRNSLPTTVIVALALLAAAALAGAVPVLRRAGAVPPSLTSLATRARRVLPHRR